MNATNLPKFEENAHATLKRVEAVFTERGREYGDTWRNCQFLAMKAVARKFDTTIPLWLFRALATAALVDMKYQRLEGGYKDDSMIDGIAFSLYLAEEIRDIERNKQTP